MDSKLKSVGQVLWVLRWWWALPCDLSPNTLCLSRGLRHSPHLVPGGLNGPRHRFSSHAKPTMHQCCDGCSSSVDRAASCVPPSAPRLPAQGRPLLRPKPESWETATTAVAERPSISQVLPSGLPPVQTASTSQVIEGVIFGRGLLRGLKRHSCTRWGKKLPKFPTFYLLSLSKMLQNSHLFPRWIPHWMPQIDLAAGCVGCEGLHVPSRISKQLQGGCSHWKNSCHFARRHWMQALIWPNGKNSCGYQVAVWYTSLGDQPSDWMDSQEYLSLISFDR